MASMKLYSVEEAERTLPLVRRIVGDVVNTFQKFEQARNERLNLGGKLNPGSGREDQAFALETRMQCLEAELLRYCVELQDLDIELKDYRSGLIDFYSHYQDRLVYLCWKLGEGDRIEWWHDLNAGFRGRAPITAENRSQFEGRPVAART